MFIQIRIYTRKAHQHRRVPALGRDLAHTYRTTLRAPVAAHPAETRMRLHRSVGPAQVEDKTRDHKRGNSIQGKTNSVSGVPMNAERVRAPESCSR